MRLFCYKSRRRVKGNLPALGAGVHDDEIADQVLNPATGWPTVHLIKNCSAADTLAIAAMPDPVLREAIGDALRLGRVYCQKQTDLSHRRPVPPRHLERSHWLPFRPEGTCLGLCEGLGRLSSPRLQTTGSGRCAGGPGLAGNKCGLVPMRCPSCRSPPKLGQSQDQRETGRRAKVANVESTIKTREFNDKGVMPFHG